LAIGVLATLPALGVGLVHDDLIQRLVLAGEVPGTCAGRMSSTTSRDLRHGSLLDLASGSWT